MVDKDGWVAKKDLESRRTFLKEIGAGSAILTKQNLWTSLATSLFATEASAQFNKVIAKWNPRLRPGTLWSWGSNSSGRLALGDYLTRSSPTQVAGSFTMVSNSDSGSFTHMIRSDGTLWTVGQNMGGELGVGNRTPYNSPVQVAGSWNAVAGGSSHAIGIKSNGTLWAWGTNSNGEFGNGNRNNFSSPIQIAGSWSQVAAGTSISAGIRANGTLFTWGINAYGALGINKSLGSPNQVDASGWAAVFAGDGSSIGLRTNGTLWSWGNNTAGELGLGNRTSYSSPTQVGALTNWTSTIAFTGGRTHAIKSDGTMWSWGWNVSGVLCIGSTTHYSSPVQVAGSWSAVAAGNQVTLAIRSDGTLWGCGYGGLLNTGSTTSRFSSPIQVASGSWTAVAVGWDHALGLKVDKTLWIWGNRGSGELGTGFDSTSPNQLPGSWALISSSIEDFSMGIRSDGTLWGWGTNYYGNLAQPAATTIVYSPVQIKAGSWTFAHAGYWNSFFIDTSARLWACGYNYNGNLGAGFSSPGEVSSPVQIAGSWSQVVPSYESAGGIKSDGTLWCWGGNWYGQCGQGATTPDYSSPVQVAGSWLQMAASLDYDAFWALRSDNTLWAWGHGGNGGLAQGDYLNYSSPVQIAGSWLQIVSAVYYAIGLKSDGTLWGFGGGWSYEFLSDSFDDSLPYQIPVTGSFVQVTTSNGWEGTIWAKRSDGTTFAWGYSDWGAIFGQQTGAYTSSPLQVSGTWTAFEGGYDLTYGFKADGTVWVAGQDYNGRMGLGYPYLTPTQIAGSWNQISAMNLPMSVKSYAIKSDSTLWAWGSNLRTLGIPGVTSKVVLSPTQIEGSWTAIDAYYTPAVATQSDGSVWAFGYDYNGGQWVDPYPTLPSRLLSSPVQILSPGWGGDTRTAQGHCLSVKSDGSLWSWGYNSQGELGFTINTSSPIQVAGSWIQVTTGEQSMFAIRTDGTLWTWGWNGSGQLGVGDSTSRPSPTQVAGSWTSVSSDYQTTMAIRTDGTLWAWGSNNGLIDGTPSQTVYSSPVQIAGSWTQIDVGSQIAAGIRFGDALSVWGLNSSGQLGRGGAASINSPIQLTGYWSKIFVGPGSMYGIKK